MGRRKKTVEIEDTKVDIGYGIGDLQCLSISAGVWGKRAQNSTHDGIEAYEPGVTWTEEFFVAFCYDMGSWT